MANRRRLAVGTFEAHNTRGIFPTEFERLPITPKPIDNGYKDRTESTGDASLREKISNRAALRPSFRTSFFQSVRHSNVMYGSITRCVGRNREISRNGVSGPAVTTVPNRASFSRRSEA
jgi:hypothetical protein